MGSAWVYPLLAVTGIVGSAFLWNRLLRDRPQVQDRRLLYVYLSALGGAFLGAKLAYLFAEGGTVWAHFGENPGLAWREIFTGKSITGALLGGYGAVEFVKRLAGYRRATGDLFAVIVPLGLVLGRVGCWFSGCCLGRPMAAAWYTRPDPAGVPRWPGVPIEMLFNGVMAAVGYACWRRGAFHNQLFHVYLMAYGIFRFFHEYLRDTPRIAGPISGYQVLALGIFLLGAVRYVQRNRQASVVSSG